MHDSKEICLVTVDGTDFRINEPSPFSSKWCSQKFNGPALRYELCIAIKSGYIVAYHGPFPAGKYPDITIFRRKTKTALGTVEKAMADKGYRGDLKGFTPYDATNKKHKKEMALARSRHETINGRLKAWGALGQRFRHKLDKHHLIFRSIIVIEQIKIENGRPTFMVSYSDSALMKIEKP